MPYVVASDQETEQFYIDADWLKGWASRVLGGAATWKETAALVTERAQDLCEPDFKISDSSLCTRSRQRNPSTHTTRNIRTLVEGLQAEEDRGRQVTGAAPSGNGNGKGHAPDGTLVAIRRGGKALEQAAREFEQAAETAVPIARRGLQALAGEILRIKELYVDTL